MPLIDRPIPRPGRFTRHDPIEVRKFAGPRPVAVIVMIAMIIGMIVLNLVSPWDSNTYVRLLFLFFMMVGLLRRVPSGWRTTRFVSAIALLLTAGNLPDALRQSEPVIVATVVGYVAYFAILGGLTFPIATRKFLSVVCPSCGSTRVRFPLSFKEMVCCKDCNTHWVVVDKPNKEPAIADTFD